MTLVREAMVSDPRALPANASAQEAGELLARPEVRTVLVVDGDRLVGCLTQATLVERVVAAGLDSRSTRLAEIAEPVSLTAGLARRLGYFCGTWSMCGQTAAIRASFSGPAAFFGVSERQPAFSSIGLDGV